MLNPKIHTRDWYNSFLKTCLKKYLTNCFLIISYFFVNLYLPDIWKVEDQGNRTKMRIVPGGMVVLDYCKRIGLLSDPKKERLLLLRQ